jgi:hypothetical protein
VQNQASFPGTQLFFENTVRVHGAAHFSDTGGRPQTNAGFRLGIFDYRGDGRPDYRYRGRVFYADNETPARARVDGNTTITVQGVGFHRNTTATVAAANTPVLAVSANQVIATAAATVDGVHRALRYEILAEAHPRPWRMPCTVPGPMTPSS